MSELYSEAYNRYSENPSNQNLYETVRSLDKTIGYTLASLNSTDNPVMRNKALIYTANAIKKFDPEAGAKLPTFVTSELRRLIRDQRAINAPIKIPDRVMLDNYAITKAEQRFEEERGREPDIIELADFSGISAQRIKKVQKQMPAIPTEEAFGETVLGDATPDFNREAMNMVYHDSDHVDRKIMEYKLGFGSKKQLPTQEITQRLKISPSQITRRSQRLSKRILNILEDQNALNG
jgi:DNA-directed RNA polymerase specialized sigma subunit